MTGRIKSHNRIIPTVSKQIVTGKIASCTKITNVVRVDESTPLGIVISALQIIEPGIFVRKLAMRAIFPFPEAPFPTGEPPWVE
jgi:hypothetical protein